MSESKLDPYAYQILEILYGCRPNGAYVRELHRLLGWSLGSQTLRLKKRLKILEDSAYILEQPGGRQKIYYKITQDGESEHLRKKQEEESRKETIKTLANQHPKMSEEEWEEFYYDFKEILDDWLGKIVERHGPTTSDFDAKLPFFSEIYQESIRPYAALITIKCKLIPEEPKRKDKEFQEAIEEYGFEALVQKDDKLKEQNTA